MSWDRLQCATLEYLIALFKNKKELECAASNGNIYPPYPQVTATAISQ